MSFTIIPVGAHDVVMRAKCSLAGSQQVNYVFPAMNVDGLVTGRRILRISIGGTRASRFHLRYQLWKKSVPLVGTSIAGIAKWKTRNVNS